MITILILIGIDTIAMKTLVSLLVPEDKPNFNIRIYLDKN